MGEISEQHWGVHNNREVFLFTLRNSSGAYVQLSNYGSVLVAVYVADQNGILDNVVLGYPGLQGYIDDTAYIGATIGRFANRIAGSGFELDEVRYDLEDNDNGNSNHGGYSGFHNRVFDAEINGDQLVFSLLSADGEGGYPGNLNLKVTYQWTEDNHLVMDYTADCDRRTIANFTNHAYFNLSGSAEKIFDHRLTIFADDLLEAGTNYIPTGCIVPAGELKFSQSLIREKMKITGEGIRGLNVCYVLKDGEKVLIPAAVLQEEKTGRIMEVSTSYPGLMLYTGDFLSSLHAGHGGERYQPFDGLCLECQYFPDSPNQPLFPSVILSPGEIFRQSIIFKFGTATTSTHKYQDI